MDKTSRNSCDVSVWHVWHVVSWSREGWSNVAAWFEVYVRQWALQRPNSNRDILAVHKTPRAPSIRRKHYNSWAKKLQLFRLTAQSFPDASNKVTLQQEHTFKNIYAGIFGFLHICECNMQNILLSFQMELHRPESGNDIVARRGVLQRKSNVFFRTAFTAFTVPNWGWFPCNAVWLDMRASDPQRFCQNCIAVNSEFSASAAHPQNPLNLAEELSLQS